MKIETVMHSDKGASFLITPCDRDSEKYDADQEWLADASGCEPLTREISSLLVPVRVFMIGYTEARIYYRDQSNDTRAAPADPETLEPHKRSQTDEV